MSARAKRRDKLVDRDRGRLRFLIRSMSDADLVRLDLAKVGRPRPSEVELLRLIDLKIMRVRRAHARISGKNAIGFVFDEFGEIEPARGMLTYCSCAKCDHIWPGFYLPEAATALADIMGNMICPNCGAKSDQIRMRP